MRLVNKQVVDDVTSIKDYSQMLKDETNEKEKSHNNIELSILSIHSLLCSSIFFIVFIICQLFEISLAITILFCIIFLLVICVQFTPLLFPITNYINNLIKNIDRKNETS